MAHITKCLANLQLSFRRYIQVASSLSRQYGKVNRESETAKRLDLFSVENVFSERSKFQVQNRLALIEPARSSKHASLGQDHGKAAVLVILCVVDNEPSLLLTVRSMKLQKYRGQVGFPGGNVDDSDPDLEFAALRETHEELGLVPSNFDVWGRMNPLPATHSGKMIYPIVARTGEIDITKLRMSEEEVDQAFTVSINHLCNPANIHSTRFRSKQSFTLPVYTGTEQRIWGLTAIIIHMLLTAIVPDAYSFQLKHKHDV